MSFFFVEYHFPCTIARLSCGALDSGHSSLVTTQTEGSGFLYHLPGKIWALEGFPREDLDVGERKLLLPHGLGNVEFEHSTV